MTKTVSSPAAIRSGPASRARRRSSVEETRPKTPSETEPFGEARYVDAAADDGSRGTGKRGAVALVPGAEVSVLRLDLPSGLRGAAREQVARRQVGDLIRRPVDTLHIRPFPAPGESDDWDRVLVADADRVGAWSIAAGRRARALLPDYLALPTAGDLWTLASAPDGKVIARLGPGDGFSAAPDLAAVLLERAAAEGAPRAVLRAGPVDVDGLGALAEAAGAPICDDVAALPAGIVPVRFGHDEMRLDLRHDPSVARTRLRRAVRAWSLAGISALVASGLWGTLDWRIADRLERDSRALEGETLALVQAHFVPQGPILDIRVQVAQALAAARASENLATAPAGSPGDPAPPHPLDILGRAAPILVASGAGMREARHDAGPAVDITLDLPDFAALEALVSRLENTAGLVVETRRSQARSDRVVAEIRLGPGPRDGGGSR